MFDYRLRKEHVPKEYLLTLLVLDLPSDISYSLYRAQQLSFISIPSDSIVVLYLTIIHIPQSVANLDKTLNLSPSIIPNEECVTTISESEKYAVVCVQYKMGYTIRIYKNDDVGQGK